MAPESNALRTETTVSQNPQEAFDRFLDLAAWYPREYSWSGEELVSIGIEPHVGGHCCETGPGGFRLDWGTVLAIEPAERLTFRWQISPERVPIPDQTRAGKVDVEFLPAQPHDGRQGTRVRLTHAEFDRYGENADDYLAAMSAPEGWSYILDCFRASCENGSTDEPASSTSE